MNLIFRNFFFAVGLTMLMGMYQMDAATATFSDFVLLVQSGSAMAMVAALMIVIVAIEFAFHRGD